MAKLLTMLFSKASISVSIILIFMGNVLANTQNYGIEVKGQASILVEPDSFSLSIAIIDKGRLTDKVRVIVDHKSNQVINVAQRLGIKSKDINSAQVSLRVITDNSAIESHALEVNQMLPNNQKSKVHVGIKSAQHEKRSANNMKSQYFELSRRITINFSHIKDYDQFLNKIIKIGVGQISPLAMSIDDTEKYYQQALTLAIKNAKAKAQKIANHTGKSLGDLVFVKELSSNYYRARSNSIIMSSNATSEHNSQIGNQAINASVLVKYLIE